MGGGGREEGEGNQSGKQQGFSSETLWTALLSGNAALLGFGFNSRIFYRDGNILRPYKVSNRLSKNALGACNSALKDFSVNC